MGAKPGNQHFYWDSRATETFPVVALAGSEHGAWSSWWMYWPLQEARTCLKMKPVQTKSREPRAGQIAGTRSGLP